MKKLIITAMTAAVALSFTACAGNNSAGTAANTNAKATKKVITEEELGLRKENLYAEDTKPVKAVYTKAAPGTAQRFERSYVNAPPLVPHSVDGLLPITKNNNACLNCHMPEVATSVGATPIPPTHFMDFRSQKKLDHLAQQRFNCSQCHVPQANVQPLVKNNFQPDFTSADAKHKSNLIDTLNEGVR